MAGLSGQGAQRARPRRQGTARNDIEEQDLLMDFLLCNGAISCLQDLLCSVQDLSGEAL